MLMQNEKLSRHRYLVDTQCVCLLQELFSSTDKSKRSSISSQRLALCLWHDGIYGCNCSHPNDSKPQVCCSGAKCILYCGQHQTDLHITDFQLASYFTE